MGPRHRSEGSSREGTYVLTRTYKRALCVLGGRILSLTSFFPPLFSRPHPSFLIPPLPIPPLPIPPLPLIPTPLSSSLPIPPLPNPHLLLPIPPHLSFLQSLLPHQQYGQKCHTPLDPDSIVHEVQTCSLEEIFGITAGKSGV